MTTDKKYYYIRLVDDFFDTDAMILLENMQDGHLYSNILLKLYLRSLKGDGKLMFNNRIPYNASALAQVTRHNVGTVEKALDIFQSLELVEMLDNGAIYMTDIQNFIGSSSSEADRKREYRRRIEEEKKVQKLEKGQMSGQTSDKSPPEIEIEIELELEIDKTVISKVREIYNHYLKKEIIKHNKITSSMRSNINARLKDYTPEQLIQVIDNYSTVYKSDKYWFSHKYGLTDLMRDKDVRRFIDEAEPLSNFAKDDYKKGGGTNETNQSSYEVDYSKYDFSKKGNVQWLQDDD